MRTKIDDFSQSSSKNKEKVRDLLTIIKSTQKDRSKGNVETDEEAEPGTDQTQQRNESENTEESINHELSKEDQGPFTNLQVCELF